MYRSQTEIPYRNNNLQKKSNKTKNILKKKTCLVLGVKLQGIFEKL